MRKPRLLDLGNMSDEQAATFNGYTLEQLARKHDAIADENQSLRAEVDAWSRRYGRLDAANDTLRAEVVRLREALTALTAAAKAVDECWHNGRSDELYKFVFALAAAVAAASDGETHDD